MKLWKKFVEAVKATVNNKQASLVLLNDDDNDGDYVIMVLEQELGIADTDIRALVMEAHCQGQSVLMTGTPRALNEIANRVRSRGGSPSRESVVPDPINMEVRDVVE